MPKGLNMKEMDECLQSDNIQYEDNFIAANGIADACEFCKHYFEDDDEEPCFNCIHNYNNLR